MSEDPKYESFVDVPLPLGSPLASINAHAHWHSPSRRWCGVITWRYDMDQPGAYRSGYFDFVDGQQLYDTLKRQLRELLLFGGHALNDGEEPF